MSVHESEHGWTIDRRDAYGKRVRLHVESAAVAHAIDARMEEEARHQRAALRNFRASSDLTLGEAVNAYLEARVVLPITKATERARLQNLVRQVGNRKLADVTPQAMAEYFARRREVLSPFTLYRESKHLAAMFRWFAEQWFIPASPVASITPAPPKESRARALTYTETRELVANCGDRLRPRVLLALDAGLSAKEAMTLRLRHLDWKEQSIDVHPIKRRAFRQVPMTARLAALLREITRTVANPDAIICSWQMQEIKHRISFMRSLRLKVPFHFRYHDLRHTFATRLAGVAQRPRIVQFLLGHHATTPTEKYDHPTPQETRAAIDAMDAANQKGETL